MKQNNTITDEEFLNNLANQVDKANPKTANRLRHIADTYQQMKQSKRVETKGAEADFYNTGAPFLFQLRDGSQLTGSVVSTGGYVLILNTDAGKVMVHKHAIEVVRQA